MCGASGRAVGLAFGLLLALASGAAASSTAAQQPASEPDHAIVPPPADPVVRPVDAELEALTRRVAGELRCPVCQGLSIGDSPSELAVEMKDLIRDQLAAGRTPDEVKAYFVERYGTWVLLEPEPRGFNLLVYLLPLAAVLGGGILIAAAVRRWTAPSAPPPAASAAEGSSAAGESVDPVQASARPGPPAAAAAAAAESWDDVALEANARSTD